MLMSRLTHRYIENTVISDNYTYNVDSIITYKMCSECDIIVASISHLPSTLVCLHYT